MHKVTYCNSKSCHQDCVCSSICNLPKKSNNFIEKIKTVNISPSATPTRKRGK